MENSIVLFFLVVTLFFPNIGLFVNGQDTNSTVIGAVLGCICLVVFIAAILSIVMCCKGNSCSVHPTNQGNTTNITLNVEQRPPLGPPSYSSTHLGPPSYSNIYPPGRLPPITSHHHPSSQTQRQGASQTNNQGALQTLVMTPPPAYSRLERQSMSVTSSVNSV